MVFLSFSFFSFFSFLSFSFHFFSYPVGFDFGNLFYVVSPDRTLHSCTIITRTESIHTADDWVKKSAKNRFPTTYSHFPGSISNFSRQFPFSSHPQPLGTSIQTISW
ncbi:hypothetical protein B0I72DRAFT_139271 [Yarrowia lipolytica]|uniref:Secreted protein n=1 Tax=Yarrowia lipolytica TaxID=4952 RepID=A0A371C3W0_YARLL|nr:hypothetical protein BKA91DRAFT_140309 [Yarrowia lipolytica]KAE8169632.1 hypothetical protein BKA90DRAFT_142239 [Yarrowia lipolytica]RDW24984.1 hypothetical protein B0I71DRAFT_133358 [Yarrowia lipolytica]RDW31724.1 hypothetical protein B0I72DRAFT_139271 [Yarrowia lipolytica]RDW38594.1 hypothetical protein B0I73DRAFT_133430 [Yarrowia lipolytica]